MNILNQQLILPGKSPYLECIRNSYPIEVSSALKLELKNESTRRKNNLSLIMVNLVFMFL